ncbi:nucleotide sugar dehydrogenase [Nitrosopumilus sp.]|nr:nucleotide sugar dehydrogenase [Nitrosopumilus sp.]
MLKNSKILYMSEQEIMNLIQQGKISVCVIGLGRIGLPTAISFANAGFNTFGIDIDLDLVNKIKTNNFPLKDEPGYEFIFESIIKEKKLMVSTNLNDVISKSDVIVLTLPTPINNENVPDYSVITSVGKQLHDLIDEGTVIIVESTVEPGFIENTLVKILEGEDNKKIVGKNFGLGVCPETANPGQIKNDFEKLPRLVGALDDKTRTIITKIYNHVFPVEIIEMKDCKTANAVKLTTNVFRDLNIAFVNELAILFEKVGINISDVLKAAKTKYNFQVHYPGPGVGGPCLPVNSYQMINLAKTWGFETLQMVDITRKINESMPDHVIELLKDAFKEKEQDIQNSNILVLGVSYKSDVKDIQISPAEPIISKLKELKANISIYDPYFKNQIIFGINTDDEFLSSASKLDAIVIVTDHKEFHNIDAEFIKNKMKGTIIIDSKQVINQDSAKKVGLIYRGIGCGKI